MEGYNCIIPQMRLEWFTWFWLPLPSRPGREGTMPFGWCVPLPCSWRSGGLHGRSSSEQVGLRRLPLLCSSSSALLFRNTDKARKMLCIAGACVFYSNQAGGRRRQEEAAESRFPVALPLLAPFLCFPTPSCLSLASWQPYPMAYSFHPLSGHAVAQKSLCCSWSAMSVCCEKHCGSCLYLRLCTWGRFRWELGGQHPLSWAAEL